MTEEEAKNAPEGMKFKKMNGKGHENYQYAMTVSTFDCTGCSNCAKVCPAKEKALVMKPIDTQVESQKGFDYGRTLSVKKRTARASAQSEELAVPSAAARVLGRMRRLRRNTVRKAHYAGLRRQSLYLERNGLFPPSGAAAHRPRRTRKTTRALVRLGQTRSFEDNAEHGLGMEIAAKQLRARLANEIAAISDADVKTAYDAWMATYDDGEANAKTTEDLIAALEENGSAEAKAVLDYKDFLSKKAV